MALLSVAGCSRAEVDVEGAHASGVRYLQDSYPDRVDAGTVVLEGGRIARGDSLYQGVVGRANCIMCHGPALRGGDDGTNLRDGDWHEIDGSYQSIRSIIITGLDKPDHIVMPPRGGTPLSDAGVDAIAAFVYWIAHQGERPAVGSQ
ncbi:MAG: cytochrome c [Gemmatimonadetes bacterium]|nr:cytochrome c [Gemmatimonadota bacterium]